MKDSSGDLRRKLETQVRLRKRAEQDRSGLLAQTAYLGTLGLLLVLPTLGGAYLGLWLDNSSAGYSMCWTLGLMVAGLFFGVVSVYWFVRNDHA